MAERGEGGGWSWEGPDPATHPIRAFVKPEGETLSHASRRVEEEAPESPQLSGYHRDGTIPV